MPSVFHPTEQEAEARIRASLPARTAQSHKGSCGNALLYCGSPAYTGAALLAATAATRTGAGITHLCAPEEVLLPVRIRLPEAVCHPTRPLVEQPSALATADRLVGSRGAILIGCGIGRRDGSADAAFCEQLSLLLAAHGVPVVLDADALNMLSADPCAAKSLLSAAKRPVILTPHPGEFARLTGLSIAEIEADRIGHAARYAREANVILLLKGHGTVLATPQGDCTINPSGSPALAKGGSGDVLAGALLGLLTGGMPPIEAAFAAAYLHGAAGERLAACDSLYGLLPSELPAAMAREIARILHKTEG